MKALISYSTFNEWIIGSMRQIYHVIRTESYNNSSFKGAIIWDDKDRMKWHFKPDRDRLVITDLAASRPVRHCYGAYQFTISKEASNDTI